jgi:hypothetical protein
LRWVRAAGEVPALLRLAFYDNKLHGRSRKNVITKAPRPPPTGTGELIGVRLQPDQLGALDKWIARHPDPKPSRPEAIRRMVTEHLAGERLLPSRPDLRKGQRSIKVENLNAENDR